ncbi:MAG: cytochrome c biogenesis protein ResB, partial [Oscillospiraceae bacterium]|nr:cytochrome c biogenesis protein ResB [Oscillospiraceae bacterium]
MKKVFQFLRSMRFGILLLLLIAAFSVLGTVIPQGREIKWYVETYPTAHPAIFFLKLNDVFNIRYFLLL